MNNSCSKNSYSAKICAFSSPVRTLYAPNASDSSSFSPGRILTGAMKLTFFFIYSVINAEIDPNSDEIYVRHASWLQDVILTEWEDYYNNLALRNENNSN